jgi:hypothetical protein
VSLDTFSTFYYGYVIDDSNYQIDFDEGGAELTAEVAVGSYTPTDFATAIKVALDTAGALTYTVTFTRSTRKITISAGSNFTLRCSSGTHIGTGTWTLMGFSGSNKTGASTYTGGAASGDYYSPQFILQEYVDSDDYQEAVDASINETASGVVEVVKFGTRSFMECNIKYATDITQDGTVIKTNATGVADLRRFMQYLVTKGPCQFMPDLSDTATYTDMILESTEQNSKGTGYRLREMYDRGLPGYFQTGKLKFRVIE